MSNTGMVTFSANYENTEEVKHFNLLGSVIEEEDTCKREVTRRFALKRTAITGIARIWRDRDLKTAAKSSLVKGLVYPVATYSCET